MKLVLDTEDSFTNNINTVEQVYTFASVVPDGVYAANRATTQEMQLITHAVPHPQVTQHSPSQLLLDLGPQGAITNNGTCLSDWRGTQHA